MITHDDVFDRLIDANPHPDTSDLVPTSAQVAAFLRELEEAPVETITKPPEPDNKPARGGLIAAAGAFAAILIVIGAAWLLRNDQGEITPADTTVPPTTVATTTVPPKQEAAVSASSQAVLDEFVSTYNAGDVSSHLALFADGVTVVLGDNGGRPSPNGAQSGTAFNRTRAQHRERIAHEARMNTSIELSECQGDEVVLCTARYSDFLSDALLEGDVTTITAEISDGRIEAFTEVAVNGRDYDDWMREIMQWAGAEHGVDLNDFNPSYQPASAVKWHVFGRLYLDYARRNVGPLPFAEQTATEDVVTIWKVLDGLTNESRDTFDQWAEPSIVYELSERTLDRAGVEAWASWLTASGSALTIAECEPRFTSSVKCSVLIDEPFRTSALWNGVRDEVGMDWTFTVEGGVVTEVLVRDGTLETYLGEIAAIQQFGADRGVEVLVDPATGFWVGSAANVDAVMQLVGEYTQLDS